MILVKIGTQELLGIGIAFLFVVAVISISVIVVKRFTKK